MFNNLPTNDAVKVLKTLNALILDTGDEDIYDTWFTFGIPDECDDNIYYDIATDKEDFAYILRLFAELIAKEVYYE